MDSTIATMAPVALDAIEREKECERRRKIERQRDETYSGIQVMAMIAPAALEVMSSPDSNSRENAYLGIRAAVGVSGWGF